MLVFAVDGDCDDEDVIDSPELSYQAKPVCQVLFPDDVSRLCIRGSYSQICQLS